MMQINLTGFLEKNTQPFLLELWKLLLSAQESFGGIPAIFLEQKKEELRQKKVTIRSIDCIRNTFYQFKGLVNQLDSSFFFLTLWF